MLRALKNWHLTETAAQPQTMATTLHHNSTEAKKYMKGYEISSWRAGLPYKAVIIHCIFNSPQGLFFSSCVSL